MDSIYRWQELGARQWDSYLLPSKPFCPFQFGMECGLFPLYIFPPCAGGGAAGADSLHRALVHNLKCVTFRAFHLYFMQNGSCEGCKLEGSLSLGPQGDACGVVGSSCIPPFSPEGLDSG